MFEKKKKSRRQLSLKLKDTDQNSGLQKKTLFASLKVNITSLIIRRFHRTSSHQRCDNFTILTFTDKNLTHKAQLRTQEKVPRWAKISS